MLLSSHALAELAKVADDVVIVERGRLVAQAPLAELTSGDGASLRVRAAEQDRLAAALRERGATVSSDEDGALIVQGMVADAVGRASVESVIPLSELSPRQAQLEEAFLSLTDGADQ